jgi:hypothetical protein
VRRGVGGHQQHPPAEALGEGRGVARQPREPHPLGDQVDGSHGLRHDGRDEQRVEGWGDLKQREDDARHRRGGGVGLVEREQPPGVAGVA